MINAFKKLKLKWYDIIIGSILMLLVFLLFTRLSPPTPELLCTGDCDTVKTMDSYGIDSNPITNCSCVYGAPIEPFQFYYSIRSLSMLFVGALYYSLRNRPTHMQLFLAVLAMSLLFAMLYVLIPTFLAFFNQG
jgi:energy-coupling factor transporter transmembrane protein EcfT